MPSPFADALHEFVKASNAYANDVQRCKAAGIAPNSGLDRYLAQAGDVLERELRELIRAESTGERAHLLSQTPQQVFESAFQRP